MTRLFRKPMEIKSSDSLEGKEHWEELNTKLKEAN